MYIVCNTKKGDVKKALRHLLNGQTADEIWERSEVPTGGELEENTDAPLYIATTARTVSIQVSMKDYKHLKTITAPQEMREQVNQRKVDYVINLNTRTVHKKDCLFKGKKIIKASLINVKNTGLGVCNRCK